MGVHNLPEGLALGVAPAIGEEAAFLLLASLALHNLPEGLAVAALAAGVATALAVGLGTATASWSAAALLWALGIAAGVMAHTVLEIWSRPVWPDVALAGTAGAAGYARLWALLAA